jgi:hypothetical protein
MQRLSESHTSGQARQIQWRRHTQSRGERSLGMARAVSLYCSVNRLFSHTTDNTISVYTIFGDSYINRVTKEVVSSRNPSR